MFTAHVRDYESVIADDSQRAVFGSVLTMMPLSRVNTDRI